MRNKVNAIQTGTILLALAFLSRFIGFLREILFANYYGIDPVMDAFVLANNIPAILLAWIFSGIVTAYTPLLSKEDEKGAEYGLLFTRKTINILLIISVITSLIGIFFSKPLIYIFAHGWFTGEVQTETIFYANIFVKIAFASTLFTAFPGIWAAYLRYKKVFILPNILTEILPKITAIAFVFISLYIGAAWIIAGTISGYILATFVLFFFLRKKFKYKPNKVIEDDAKKDSIIKKIMLLSIPVFIGSAIQQINSFVDTELATWLPSGSPAALNYGNLMASIGAALFSTGILTMIYPKLAEAYAKKDKERFSFLFNGGILSALVFTVPLIFIGIFFSETLIQIVFERDAFDVRATSMTADAFLCYSLGILFVVISGYITTVFYSMHDMKSPLLISIISVIVNVTVSILLIKKYQLIGLALGTVFANMLSSIVLFIIFIIKNHGILGSIKGLASKGSKITLGAGFSVGIAKLIYIFMLNNLGGYFPRTLMFIAVAIIGAAIYLFLLWLFRIKEIEFIKLLIPRKRK